MTHAVEWQRYSRALHRAMAEDLEESHQKARPHALETADHWISVGLTIGLERPHQARRLLALIEAEEAEWTWLEMSPLSGHRIEASGTLLFWRARRVLGARGQQRRKIGSADG